MYEFEYVKPEEWKPVRDELFEIIHALQDEVREHFTFQFRFVGSSARNMITRNRWGNKGFDFDVDIEINPPKKNYTPRQIRNILHQGLDRVIHPDGRRYSDYDYAEDSTRVLTIKVKDQANSLIRHSCDFCIVRKDEDGEKMYIRHNKLLGTYTWEYQSQDFKALPEKVAWIKKNGYWQEVRDLYLQKKNRNLITNKHSRSIFAETVQEVWSRYV